MGEFWMILFWKKSTDLKPLTLISGLLTGRFYSETGEPTGTLLQTEASLAEGQRIKAQSEAHKLHFPPCNSQWSAAEGGRVWCTNKRYGNSSELINKSNAIAVTSICTEAKMLTFFFFTRKLRKLIFWCIQQNTALVNCSNSHLFLQIKFWSTYTSIHPNLETTMLVW